jgi:hypothetical protein
MSTGVRMSASASMGMSASGRGRGRMSTGVSVMAVQHVLRVFRVSEMSRLAAASVAQAGAGRVHSVFHHCFNIIRPDGSWLAVARAPFPRTPDAIIVEARAHATGVAGAADFYSFPGLEPGLATEIAPARIAIPGAGIEIALDGAALFDTRRQPFPRSGRNPARTARNLAAADALIRRDGRACDAPEFRRRAEPALAALAAAIIADDDIATRPHCEALLGLGIGLTPSGDDILGGIAAGLFLGGAARDGGGKRFLSALRGLLRDDRRTTDVSARALKLCMDGEISDGVFEAARAILFDDGAATTRAISSLLALGHTSGTETARGLCLGLRLAEEIFCRRHAGGGN